MVSTMKRTIVLAFAAAMADAAHALGCGSQADNRHVSLAPPAEGTSMGPGDVFRMQIVGEKDLPEEFVDAVTLAGPPDEVAAGVIRLGRSGITQFMLYPLAVDGRVETTIERFQRELMPLVRAAGR